MLKAQVLSLIAFRARRDLRISQALVSLLATVSVCQLAAARRSSGAVAAEMSLPVSEPSAGASRLAFLREKFFCFVGGIFTFWGWKTHLFSGEK